LASPWGASYFPNVPLVTHEGEIVHFFDDLIKDKIVAVNFIYTRCPDTCPLETAQLVQVQQILGDRMGEDVFFYSISIDPANDTPRVLAQYRKRFKANWTFLTGEKSDITKLRKKLGLYIAEIQDGSNNHNVNMIIGNQATGRWMKRSPFENPHVMADQIGNWLTGWKSPPRGLDYASAPKLRSIPRGEQIYRTRCASCHSLTGEELEGALGPDLLGVVQRRRLAWLLNWLRAPDQMLKKKDPIAIALYEIYDKLPMPNMRLNRQESLAVLDYIDQETQRISSGAEGNSNRKPAIVGSTESFERSASDVVTISNAWVRHAHEDAKVNAAYMTMVNVGSEELALVAIGCDAFERVELHEMAFVDGMMEMRELSDLKIPLNGRVHFEPGGKHLMLVGPREKMTVGEIVNMTLTFESGAKQTVSLKVAAK
jgi:copper(I)-binding protein/cytochrome oxidase Cu insertion factor (SCO1/SenC/PrrC family)